MYENYSVLFVDDETNILQSIRRGLIDETFQAFYASSGLEALTLMENQKIDVIVTDMRMPVMTGLELLRLVSAQYPKTVKIVLSGYTQLPQILATINQVDIFKFLTKPWQLDELISMVYKALDYYILQELNSHHLQVMETQNRTFQSILKKSKDALAYARRSNEALGACGKAVLDFGKDFSPEQHETYQNIFLLRGALFERLSQALVLGQTETPGSVLTKFLTDQMLSKFPNVRIQNLPDGTDKLTVNMQLLDAVLEATLLVFSEEYLAHGLYLYLGVSSDQIYSVSMQLPSAYTPNNSTTTAAVFDVKLYFLTLLVKKLLEVDHITFQAVKADGNLLIAMRLVGEPPQKSE